MMYTSPQFESKEAARSQVKPLQNQQRPILGCHVGQSPPVQGAEWGVSMNWCYKHGWYHCNRPEHGSKQVIQQPIKRIASDSQRLKLVMSACASVANCLNIIGHKVACIAVFSADGVNSGSRCWAQGLWRCRHCPEMHFLNSLDRRQLSDMTPKYGSLLVLERSNQASSDSNLGEVYIIGFLKVCSLLWYKI